MRPQPRCGSGEERNSVAHRILRNNTIRMGIGMISEDRVSVNIDLSTFLPPHALAEPLCYTAYSHA